MSNLHIKVNSAMLTARLVHASIGSSFDESCNHTFPTAIVVNIQLIGFVLDHVVGLLLVQSGEDVGGGHCGRM